jgi:hypothetical protein
VTCQLLLILVLRERKFGETGYIHCEIALISKHVRLQGFYFIVIKKEYQTCCMSIELGVSAILN